MAAIRALSLGVSLRVTWSLKGPDTKSVSWSSLFLLLDQSFFKTGFDSWIDKFDILLKVKRIIFRLFVSKPVLARLASPFREHEVELEISLLDDVFCERRD